MSKETPILDFFNKINPFITTLIAIVAIAIPVAGFSFEQGYFSIFGLHSEIFPRDMTEAWGRSYAVAIFVLYFVSQYYIKVIGWTLAYLILLSFIVIFILSYFEKKSIRNFFDGVVKIEESKGWIGNTIYVIKCMYKDLKWLYNLMFYFFIVFTIGVLVIAIPHVKGTKIAIEHISKFNNEKCEQTKWSYCVQIKDLNSNIILYEGYLVAASSSYIALYDGLKTEVIPRLDGYSLIRYQTFD